jgi:hypothetical protein
MADSPRDILRQGVFQARRKGIANGLKILWTAEHDAQLYAHVQNLSEKQLHEAAEAKPFSSGTVIGEPSKALKLQAMDSTALSWLFEISNETPDLTNDVIKVAGWRLQNFGKNGPVFFCHDSSTLPVGQSSMPWKSGSKLMANVTFPAAGVSAVSDQVRGMIAAGVLRGASVGFVPGKFKFTTDPQRPMGTLTEWSCCGVPANPLCLVVGPAGSFKSASASVAGPTATREQRIAEARRLTAAAYRA